MCKKITDESRRQQTPQMRNKVPPTAFGTSNIALLNRNVLWSHSESIWAHSNSLKTSTHNTHTPTCINTPNTVMKHPSASSIEMTWAGKHKPVHKPGVIEKISGRLKETLVIENITCCPSIVTVVFKLIPAPGPISHTFKKNQQRSKGRKRHREGNETVAEKQSRKGKRN
jgi:hypothetical protein